MVFCVLLAIQWLDNQYKTIIMSETTVKTGHPKGLYFLFFTEMWERFSYYGMRAIFILFMTKILLMKDADASQIYGSYTGLVYLTPLLGGYLCDKYLEIIL